MPPPLSPLSRLSPPHHRSIHGVHDDSKDKPFELELSWLCEASGWKHVPVPAARRAEADAWARARIEEEEQADDDEDAEMAA